MIHYSRQFSTYSILLTILVVGNVSGQRAPVRYIPIDSISFVPPGQDVKLDFKGKIKNNIRVPTCYPWLRTATPIGTRWVGDTIYLTIDQEKVEFIEKKGLGVDYYYFPAERLVSKTYRKEHTLIIPRAVVKEIATDSILFCLTINLYREKRNGVRNSKERNLWIKRKDLDGVLIHELDLDDGFSEKFQIQEKNR